MSPMPRLVNSVIFDVFRDKCYSPNDDHTTPCYFSHPVNKTRYQEINFATDNVLLDCSARSVSWKDDEGEIDGPILKMIVPGNFKNRRWLIFKLDFFMMTF